MKLAFCLFKFFPFGGLQRDFLRISQHCLNRGHEVHVFVMEWKGDTLPGLIIHEIGRRGLQNHTQCNYFIQKVSERLKNVKYDLVIGFNKMPHLDVYYAADVCYQARVREKHGRWYRLLPRYRKWMTLERAVFARARSTKILLISPLQQAAFEKHYQTEDRRFYLLPPGIDKLYQTLPSDYRIRSDVRQNSHISKNDFMVVMVGSGFKTKGLDRVLYGLASLPIAIREKCHLVVIGQDHPGPFLKLAKRLRVSNHVHFLGGQPDVAQFLLAADLLVHPAYHENTGTVLLEALGAGLPVLTTDTCGYAHYIKEAGAGLVLASPFQQEGFNQALQKMLLSERRDHWRQNAFAFAKQHELYQMPEKAVDLIEYFGHERGNANR